LADQFPDDAFCSQAFDGAEAALGVLSQDLGEEERRRNPGHAGMVTSRLKLVRSSHLYLALVTPISGSTIWRMKQLPPAPPGHR
jgi:hypothetical protein